MMLCKKCEAEISEDSKFCPSCGQTVKTKNSQSGIIGKLSTYIFLIIGSLFCYFVAVADGVKDINNPATAFGFAVGSAGIPLILAFVVAFFGRKKNNGKINWNQFALYFMFFALVMLIIANLGKI